MAVSELLLLRFQCKSECFPGGEIRFHVLVRFSRHQMIQIVYMSWNTTIRIIRRNLVESICSESSEQHEFRPNTKCWSFPKSWGFLYIFTKLSKLCIWVEKTTIRILRRDLVESVCSQSPQLLNGMSPLFLQPQFPRTPVEGMFLYFLGKYNFPGGEIQCMSPLSFGIDSRCFRK